VGKPEGKKKNCFGNLSADLTIILKAVKKYAERPNSVTCNLFSHGTNETAPNYMQHIPSWEAKNSWPSHVPTFYWTGNFAAVFVRGDHLSLSWQKSIQTTTSQYISLRHVLILSSNQNLNFQSGRSPSYFSIKTLHAFNVYNVCATRLIFFITIMYYTSCRPLQERNNLKKC
jgi:hypothetical protein